MRISVTRLVVMVLVTGACASGNGEGATTTDSEPGTSVPSQTTTSEVSTTAAESTETSMVATTTTAAPEPPLTESDGTFSILWSSVSNPFWSSSAGSAADPFFFIHTFPDVDGFYFSLEMYTTGYGALWQGELGDVDIICNEAAPAPNSTGICPHFDPDGPGPLGDLNADFTATGSITITKLDDDGYEIVVNEVVFSDGSRIDAFQLTGP